MKLERLIYQTGKQKSQKTEWLLGWLGSRGDRSIDLVRALETTRNTLGPIGVISWWTWKMTSQDPPNSPCLYRELSSASAWQADAVGQGKHWEWDTRGTREQDVSGCEDVGIKLADGNATNGMSNEPFYIQCCLFSAHESLEVTFIFIALHRKSTFQRYLQRQAFLDLNNR